MGCLTTNMMITHFTPKKYSYWLSDNSFNIKLQDSELDVFQRPFPLPPPVSLWFSSPLRFRPRCKASPLRQGLVTLPASQWPTKTLAPDVKTPVPFKWKGTKAQLFPKRSSRIYENDCRGECAECSTYLEMLWRYWGILHPAPTPGLPRVSPPPPGSSGIQ